MTKRPKAPGLVIWSFVFGHLVFRLWSSVFGHLVFHPLVLIQQAMRITKVSWLPFRLPYVAPFATAHGIDQAREGFLLRLTCEDGSKGLGEASPQPAFGGGTLPDALREMAGLAPALVGLSLPEADEQAAHMDLRRPGASAVACALDTALLDLRAQAAGVPLAALLAESLIPTASSKPRTLIPVNATVGAPTIEGARQAAQHAVARGFRCIKLKVGVAGSRVGELERIAAVRDAIGARVELRIDANGAWSAEDAIAIIRAAETCRLELVEQPVAADDLRGMGRVRAAVATPIAADESVGTLPQAREVVAAGAADVLVVKPMMAGGLRPAQAIVDVAYQSGLRAIVTTTIDAGVAVAAAAHLAARLPDPPLACGLATGALLAGELIDKPLVIDESTMFLPNGPGLGVALNQRQLARYAGAWQEVSA
jgi:o-succinylbenzoate synthase